MKSNRIKHTVAGTLTVAALVALSVVNAAAQEHMGHAGQAGQQQTGHLYAEHTKMPIAR